MRTAGRLRHCGFQITKWKRFIDVFSSPSNLEGNRRAYPINCGVCSWYTTMNVSLFDGLWSYENIGPRRKHVKIILLHVLLWFVMRTLGQLWTCKNRFAFRFDFGVKCCCIFLFHFVFLVFHSDFACYFTSINFLFCFSLFSILKFSLFDFKYVEIKIMKKIIKRGLIIFHFYFILFYFFVVTVKIS